MSEPLIHTPGPFGENGNFLLERELGSGGMGGVYMGRDKMLDRPVAVKVMLKEYGDDPEFVEKFKKEAQSAARLIHPNIAQVYSYGICNGMPYIAMELASGGSLYSIMNANPGKTDVTRVLKICLQVAQALQCASDLGCVHGDVKPENILLDANGNAKLVDFGLAAMQKDTDEIWGTPYYISPEKVKREPIDFRADMYSLGGTLYHALTGCAPFEGEDSIAVIKKRFEAPPTPPSELRPEISPAIDELVMTMLALNKDDRFPTFEALIAAFRRVLTRGITQKLPAMPGSRRPMMMRGRRMSTMRRPEQETPEEEEEDVPKKKKRKASRVRSSDEDDDEEEGGNLGAKVFGVVFGVIILIAVVVGGLVWYQVADKKSRAAEEQSQIDNGIEKARKAIADTMSGASKFADEFDTFAARAIEACQKPTDELMKVIPEEQRALLKPSPTKELLDAIASTNETVKAEEPAAATNAPAATPVVAKSLASLPKFREPTEDEKDPKSPEGEAYLKAKKEFEAEQLQKLREAASKPAAEGGQAADGQTALAAGAATDAKTVSQTPQVILDMNDLWERAYGCQAAAIRIRQAVKQVLQKGAEAEAIREQSRENMDKLAALSREVVELFDRVKGSKDVEFVRKGITYIKNKGEKTVTRTLKEIRIEKLKAEREAKAKADAEAEAARKKQQEEDRKKKVEEETAEARAKFDAICTQGCFRQLDWKHALRLLTQLKESFTTPEGQLAVDLEIRKVNDMKMVHDIFIKNVKGHQFKGKLKGCRVEEVNEKELVLYKQGVQGKTKIPWMKFYKDYPGNLNELFNAYIVNARMPGAKVPISNVLEWANAMTGAALTMQLVCGEVNGAMDRAQKLMQTIVAQFGEYEKTAKEIFPDMSFEEKKEEE